MLTMKADRIYSTSTLMAARNANSRSRTCEKTDAAYMRLGSLLSLKNKHPLDFRGPSFSNSNVLAT